jgi:uncharacterized membrane protein
MIRMMILFTITGLVLAIIGMPLSMGKIPPNHFYGFRTRRTLSDPDIWYPANVYAGRLMTIGGLIISIAAPLLVVIPGIDLHTYSNGFAIVMLVVICVVTTLSLNYIRRL